MYYILVWNDYFEAANINQDIKDFYQLIFLSFDSRLVNKALISDDLIIVQSSFYLNPGKILNGNSRELEKFIYKNKEKKVFFKNVDDFMPYNFKHFHKLIISNYIKNTRNAKVIMMNDVFYINGQGFVQKAKVQIPNSIMIYRDIH